MSTNYIEQREPSYLFGSAIITLMIGALSFITAFAWNTYIQSTFKFCTNGCDALQTKLSYAILVSAISIISIFLVVYFIDGKRI